MTIARIVAATIALAFATSFAAPAQADVAACLKAAEQAQPLRAQGKLLASRAQLITCSASSCPAAVRVDCVRWLGEVEQALPTIIVRARSESGEDLANVSVLIDGVRVSTSLDGLPIALDPGTRTVRFESPARAAVERSLIIRQGERDVSVPVTLASLDAKPAPPRRPQPSRGIPLAAAVLGGLGIALAGSGAVLWGIGASDHGELESTCARSSSCAHDDVVAARTKLIAGDVLVIAGAFSLAASVVIAIMSRGGEPSPSTARSTSSLFAF